MATMIRRSRKKHVCSCGRTFAHAVSLRRHRFVSGCVDDEPPPAEVPAEPDEPPPPAYLQTLSLEQVYELHALANQRLNPTPTTAMRLRQLSGHAACFAREFSSWLAEETCGLARRVAAAGARGLPEFLGGAIRGILSLVALAATTAILLAALAMGATASAPTTPPLSARPRVSRPGSLASAAKVVAQFYQSLDHGSYAAAYRCLSPAWRDELGYDAFVKGWRATHKVTCELRGGRLQSNGSARIRVRLTAIVHARRMVYTGYYTLVSNGRRWQLDRSNLSR